MHRWLALGPLLILPALGCERSAEPIDRTPPAEARATPEEIPVFGSDQWDARLTVDDLERGRLDPAWRAVVRIDSPQRSGAVPSEERFEEMTPASINDAPMNLGLGAGSEGASVLRLQILLDRALFSPGIIDGHWGKNTEKALYWFQESQALPQTALLDEASFVRLAEAAAGPAELVGPHRLSEEDVAGPFVTIPEDIYEKAELDCLCYESLGEKLAEIFHTSPEVLRQLNPGIELDGLSAGDELQVPLVRNPEAAKGREIDEIVISASGFYVHALDPQGKIVMHFPTTLGSTFDPSPTGEHRVTSITRDPWWHYQPEILKHVDSSKPDAKIPPGPNNAVGAVWMALSIPHYGIHGTSAPETIGYTTSAGCVRLTNWDALFLADRIEKGVGVHFTPSRS